MNLLQCFLLKICVEAISIARYDTAHIARSLRSDLVDVIEAFSIRASMEQGHSAFHTLDQARVGLVATSSTT